MCHIAQQPAGLQSLPHTCRVQGTCAGARAGALGGMHIWGAGRMCASPAHAQGDGHVQGGARTLHFVGLGAHVHLSTLTHFSHHCTTRTSLIDGNIPFLSVLMG